MSKQFSAREIALIKLAYSNGITDAKELAHFMGQCGHESGGINKTQEGFVYSSVERVIATVSSTSKRATNNEIDAAIKLAKEGKPETLANYMYNDRMGNSKDGDDGWKYSGKGYIQLTGKDNYTAFNAYMQGKGFTEDFIKNPELLKDPEYAGYSAIYFWNKDVKYYNGMSVAAIRTKINGGETDADKLASRVNWTNKYEAKLTDERIKNIVDGKEVPRIDIVKNGSVGLDAEDVQLQLIELKFLTGFADGNFGPGSAKALKAFQTAHGLEANGVADEKTLTLLNKLAPLHDKVLQTEQQITAKLDEIDKLNDHLKGYDPIRDIGEIAKADADIEQARNDIAQLEMSKNDHIDQTIARKEAEIETLKNSITALKVDNPVTAVDESASTGTIPSQEAALNLQITTIENDINALEERRDSVYEQRADDLKEKNSELQKNIDDYDKKHIDTLTALQTKIDNDSNTTFDSIKDDLKAADIQVVTPSGLTAEEFASINLLNPKNGDEAKAAQQYLYDQDAFGNKPYADAVDGKWGGGSQTAVQQLLYNQGHFPEGKTEASAVDGDFGTGSKNVLESFNQKQSDYLDNLKAEELSRLVSDEKTERLEQKPEIIKNIQEEIKINDAYKADLEKSANELPTRQIALLDKEIAKRDEAIGRYDNALTKLDPETLDTNSKNAYDLVKDDLAKSKELSPLLSASETKLIELSSLDPTKTVDVKALQQVFCDRGLLTADEVKGSYGPKTQGLVKDALGIERATTFDADDKLSLDDLTKISEKALNELTPAELRDKILALQSPLEAEKSELEQLKEKQVKVPDVDKTSEPIAQVEQPESTRLRVSSGDPDIDRILQATLNGNHEEVIRLTREMVQRPDMQELNQNLLAEARQTNDLIREQQQLEQQEIARQQELQQAQQAQQEKQQSGPSMSR